ncbi:TRAP transporter large permease [Chloroflexota bacterium]
MLALGIGILIALLVLGVPIYLSIFVGVIFLVIYVMGVDPMVMAMVPFDKVNQFVLLAIPFFLLAGQLIAIGGAGKPLVKFLSALMGHIPGGPAYVIIVACTIFAAMSSTSIAAIAAFGPVVVPMMLQMGYGKKFSLGLLIVASTLGPLIPPSIPLILYGVIAEQSVRTLYTAAFIPGLLLAFLLSVTVFFWSRRGHYTKPPRSSWTERWQAFKEAWPVLLMPVVVLIPIYAGLVTPTEASAVCAVYALLLGTVAYRQLKLRQIWQALRQTVAACAMIYFILMAAFMLNLVLTYIRIPFELSEALSNAGFSAGIFMLMVIIAYLIMGMILDQSAILLVSVPILLASVIAQGISPIVYGVFAVVAIEIASVTPPYGITLFATCGILRERFELVARSCILFYPAVIVGFFLIAYVPQITLFLPRMLGLSV